jgi:hypothetical protein
LISTLILTNNPSTETQYTPSLSQPKDTVLNQNAEAVRFYADNQPKRNKAELGIAQEIAEDASNEL